MIIRALEFNEKTFLDSSIEFLLSQGVPESKIEEAKKNQAFEDIQKDRLGAYKEESDPLYMEWQFDQTPESEQVWRDKVAEIKARYPLPSEV